MIESPRQQLTTHSLCVSFSRLRVISTTLRSTLAITIASTHLACGLSRAPLTLLKVRHDQPVELRIEKRSNEKWTRQPPPPRGPFDGQGHRLGAESPAMVSVSSSSTAAAAAPGGSRGTGSGAGISFETKLEVDDKKPVTTLQIRLRDGQRSVHQSHLVSMQRHDTFWRLLVCPDATADIHSPSRLDSADHFLQDDRTLQPLSHDRRCQEIHRSCQSELCRGSLRVANDVPDQGTE